MPPRLAFVDGEVSFWRTGAEDWAPAQVNTPLAAGDSLYASSGGNLELELGPRTFVRAGSDTELDLESLETGFMQFRVTGGHVALDAPEMPPGQTIEIDTPSAAFTLEKPGYYRVDVDDQGTTFTTRRGGEASADPAGGDTTEIGPDRRMELEGTDTATVATSDAPEPDTWDRWNFDRSAERGEKPQSAAYVPPTLAGTDDLDRYGDWHEEPQYGHVWVPRAVPAGWAPYGQGRWIWDPYYGWTWIDEAPWGWAPFHYGRWVTIGGAWAWAPGPVVVAPVYAPALVAFFGPTVSVSVATPFVGWVALGWGEPCIPWWGRPGFVGHAWWGGWGGPRIVNNVVIQRNTYVNVKNVRIYRNARVQNAVVAVRRAHFGRGGVQRVRVEAAKLRPVHGRLGIRPTRASLVPREGRATRPPDALRARRAVATRPPADVSHRLRAVGVNDVRPAAPAPRLAPSSRVPSTRPGRNAGPDAKRTRPVAAVPQPWHGDRGPGGRSAARWAETRPTSPRVRPPAPRVTHPGETHAAPDAGRRRRGEAPVGMRAPTHGTSTAVPRPAPPRASRPMPDGRGRPAPRDVRAREARLQPPRYASPPVVAARPHAPAASARGPRVGSRSRGAPHAGYHGGEDRASR
ncbi:MAG TPA: DUF6600 domain-containing protein [Candidatus Binatia bacterium]|nr:DUF6600 domain-containing protein [Candidatus Binatia bacterium]